MSKAEIPRFPKFVEVVLPLPLRQTFTYQIPFGFREQIKIGARLLVPFGKRGLTGYAVALHEELDPGIDVEIKDVAELIDEEPLITGEILDLARWVADYYAASWGEVLKASLPAGLNAAREEILSITSTGRTALFSARNSQAAKWKVLQILSEADEVPLRDLIMATRQSPNGNAATFKRALRELVNSDYVSTHERSVTAKVKAKTRKAVRLLKGPILANASVHDVNNVHSVHQLSPTNRDKTSAEKPLTQSQQRILNILSKNNDEMLFTQLLELADVGSSPINTLEKKGMIEVFMTEVLRDPLNDSKLPEAAKLELNDDQKTVLAEIEKGIHDREFKAFLLHGVTGSGKTEVYIRAMRIALDQGKSALMLVPEIALTPIFSRRLRAIFGNDVAILHSNLSPGERFDEWRRIRSGSARIAIGTRSAVFAPLRDLGLVVVDEEHDTSYRQHEMPFYHARDAAVMRANMAEAVVVLGSATPALESFYNARSDKYQYLHLPHRIGKRPMADAELIDMREVFRHAGKDVIFSSRLINVIRETHQRGEQSIILLNRRGFSSFVLCRSCGESLRCKNCDITLTYHRRDGRLVCHYCSHNTKTPDVCPFCQSEFLYFIGEGTEQLEDILNRVFPDMRIARIDRDTMTRKGEMTKTLLAFDAGEIDMLVGTQMLAKGHDFHNVTLVGVVSVDTMLGLPDFRSAERVFQLLTQVAGRAGRGNLPGRVLIQTYYPEHYALRYAADQDFDGFFSEEIRYRERMSYPPFVVLASIMIKHRDYAKALENAKIVRASLDRANMAKHCRILGPAPAAVSRLKGEYRQQLLIKSATRKHLRKTLNLALSEAESNGCDMRTVYVEIDPVNLM